MTQRWRRLHAHLKGLDPQATAMPPTARAGAVLALVAQVGRDDAEIVYTRRRDDLVNHPGQISFPGGRVEAGESVPQAAVREAQEEVGLRPGSATVLGVMPPLYIPPSRYWVQPVVARWDRPHPLQAQEAEVAEVLVARLATLTDPVTWRCVRLPTAGTSWAWQLDDRHLLWGATAMLTAELLDAMEPGWQRGSHPGDLPADRWVEPWRGSRQVATGDRPPLLPAAPVRALHDGLAGGPDDPPAPHQLDGWASLAASAVTGLVAGLAPDPVGYPKILVLAGPGGKGLLALATAGRLAAEGLAVSVVTSGTPRGHGPAGLRDAITPFDGVLPETDLVVDGLVGGGLRGPLRGVPHAILCALRRQDARVLSLDLPSGLHPLSGLIGDAVTADATLAVGAPRRGLLHDGLAPFVGDLYLAQPADRHPLVRLMRAPA